MNRRLEYTAKATPMVLVERPIPKAPPKGLIVKVKYCGVCHSDIHIWENPSAPRGYTFELPRILGHEISGEVHSIGNEQSTGAPSLTTGQKVVIYAWGGCGECPACLHGSQNCARRERPGSRMFGVWCDGGLQQYVEVSDSKLVLPCPDGLSLRTAALLACGGLAAYNAICTAKDSLDTSIKQTGIARLLIIGAGGLGLWAVKIAKAMYGDKVKVAVADSSEDKLPDATEAGADGVICWRKDVKPFDAAQQVKNVLGDGVDGVLDFVNIDSTVHRGYMCCNHAASMVLIGMMNGRMPPIPTVGVALKGIRIQGIFTGSVQQLKEVMQLIKDKHVSTPPITEIGLEEVQEAFYNVKNGKVKGRYVARL